MVRVEEGLFLLPANLFNELFLDSIGPFPQVFILLQTSWLIVIVAKDV